MTKRMLVDATHPEETRVAIVDSYRDVNRLEDLDFDLASKPLLKGNIYLAKVMRVEPSLQAAFVEYGGNRHGFLSFSEIHPDYFRIPVSDRPADEEDFEETTSFAEAYPDEVNADRGDDEPREIADNEEMQRTEDQPAFEGQVEATEGQVEATAEPSEQVSLTPLEPVVHETVYEPLAETIPAPQAETPAFAPQEAPAPHPLDSFTHAANIEENDQDVGLITDFGNAVVDTNLPEGAPVEGEPEAVHVESVGGDTPERFVRRAPRPPRYKIQEVVKRGMVMLIQVVKEERGNKGAALTSFLSLAGRYCVLMPNTDHGGGVSRKITNHQDRRRLKEILDQLEIPEGMAVILRTAGMEQDPPEIQRDLEYLLRLWNSIREQTLQSTAPSLIYEEANLIKRSVRDLYSQDINEILVSGETGYKRAREFMQTIMPDDVEKIKLYNDPIPLFFRYNVENQIDSLHTPVVQLRSGGYLVINPTEALVAIDVNSGRATRERHIEETAVKTNLEAADEVARQLRLRDLAGLVVIDFIDMEDNRNNTAVERRLKEAMKNDRARLQIGRLSPFGLMELSRQRLRPSLQEINFEKCPHCAGVGFIRSVDSAALSVLRVIEEEGIKQRASEITITVATSVALYLLNQKRAGLSAIESRYQMHVLIANDDSLIPPEYKLERSKNRQNTGKIPGAAAVNMDQVFADAERDLPPVIHEHVEETEAGVEGQEGEPRRPREPRDAASRDNTRRRRFRERGERGDRGGRHDNRRPRNDVPDANGVAPESAETIRPAVQAEGAEPNLNVAENAEGAPRNDQDGPRRRRRGRRGGRRRNGPEGAEPGDRWERRPRPNDGAPQSGSSFNNGPAPMIPTSIHEIDTTPRDPATERSYQQSSHAASSSHDVVNPPSDRPKGGWWRRLTGQEE